MVEAGRDFGKRRGHKRTSTTNGPLPIILVPERSWGVVALLIISQDIDQRSQLAMRNHRGKMASGEMGTEGLAKLLERANGMGFRTGSNGLVDVG